MTRRARQLAGSRAARSAARLVDLGRPVRARALAARAGGASCRDGAPVRILDVGCGVKPYYPFFAGVASEYVGVDVVENPAADLLGSVEALPVEDAIVRRRPLHAGARALRRPGAGRARAAARDGARRPGARLDARRAGLPPVARRLLALDARGPRGVCSSRTPSWTSLTVEPAAGTASALAMLLGDLRRDRAAAHAARARPGVAAQSRRSKLNRRVVTSSTSIR